MAKQPAAAMAIDVTETGGATVIRPAGVRLDLVVAPEFRAALVQLIKSGHRNLVVDLEDVGFIDSSGLGVLVSALRRARERDGVVRIVCTRDNILKIFRITGLDKVFGLHTSVAEAVSN